jgi:hypothetical protein
MKRYFYITINELPSGLYQSQVIDVVKHFRTSFALDIKLFAVVPLRGYLKSRSTIKAADPSAWVLPAVPNWNLIALNRFWAFILFLFCRPAGLISRNAFANDLALFIKKMNPKTKVVYDGRGLMKEISSDYDIYPKDFVPKVAAFEKRSLLRSDLVMCITAGMIDVWKDEYQIELPKTVVIPCTISAQFVDINPVFKDKKEGLIWVVYVGSVAPWQSIEMLTDLIEKAMKNQPSLAFQFIGDEVPSVSALKQKFGEQRVRAGRLNHKAVFDRLLQCDYGILVREATKMNRIASPTKIGEYLSAGLALIINDSMAITDLVKSNDLGHVIEDEIPVLKPIGADEKRRIRAIGLSYFDKSSTRNASKYEEVIAVLTAAS